MLPCQCFPPRVGAAWGPSLTAPSVTMEEGCSPAVAQALAPLVLAFWTQTNLPPGHRQSLCFCLTRGGGGGGVKGVVYVRLEVKWT